MAVVGLNVGREHVAAYAKLRDRFEIVGVCDLDRAKAEELAGRLRGVSAHGDLAEVCGRDDVDVVDLCTPPNLHLEHLEAVLAAGKHVICEKPLVGSLAALDRVVAAEAASGRRVMPIFQYRWGHGLQKLKHLVDAGVAGDAHTANVEVSWRRRADYYAVPWRGRWQTELGGVLLSHAVHALDMLTYVGAPVAQVFARTATRVNPIEVEDCAVASLELADGSLASISATLGSPAEITRHRFTYANLSAESGTEPYTSSADPWTLTADSPEVDEEIHRALDGLDLPPEGYIGQLHRFDAALSDGTELPVTLADARASLELITALYVSAREGRDVSLPLDPHDPAYGGWTP
ncbi:MAG TPA: Gfo/Idh/MocA family oxidoreductase [Acidimicrobiales bacterium]|nr:Gfo/Idh/MocA family oxidoreductase [Acidimicrobiales bacterium]